jgi:hypothetical protein
MKKVGIAIFCVLFCWAVILICAPNTVKSNPLVYSTSWWCLTCHDAAYPDGNLHTTHTNCASCHDGTPALFNVYTSKCVECHPAGNQGRCELVLFHAGANCLECHQKCENCP